MQIDSTIILATVNSVIELLKFRRIKRSANKNAKPGEPENFTFLSLKIDGQRVDHLFSDEALAEAQRAATQNPEDCR